GSNNLSVLLGNGDGTFQPQRLYDAGDTPTSVAVADLDGDGKLDLVVANFGSGDVSVLLGNGDGSFRPQRTYAAGDGPSSVGGADLNGDGRPDLAVANAESERGTEAVTLLFGNGDGSFQSAPRRLDLTAGDKTSENRGGAGQLPGDRPMSLAVAQLNDDNRDGVIDSLDFPDLVVATVWDITVLLGKGDGSFQDPRHFATRTFPRSVAVAHVHAANHHGVVQS